MGYVFSAIFLCAGGLTQSGLAYISVMKHA